MNVKCTWPDTDCACGRKDTAIITRLRAENAAKDRRIAELEELLRYIHDYSNNGYIVTRVEAALSGG